MAKRRKKKLTFFQRLDAAWDRVNLFWRFVLTFISAIASMNAITWAANTRTTFGLVVAVLFVLLTIYIITLWIGAADRAIDRMEQDFEAE